MKMKVLLITVVLAVYAQGVVFAKGIIEERTALNDALHTQDISGFQQQADQILKRVSALYEDARYDEAIALLQENKDLFIKAQDRYYARSVSRQGLLYLSKEDYVKAEACYKELYELNTGLINRDFSSMPGQQRRFYLESVLQDFEASYSLSLKYSVETVNSLNYNNALFIKGLLLRTTNAARAWGKYTGAKACTVYSVLLNWLE